MADLFDEIDLANIFRIPISELRLLEEEFTRTQEAVDIWKKNNQGNFELTTEGIKFKAGFVVPDNDILLALLLECYTMRDELLQI